MPSKKISDTKLVATYGLPKESYGKSTGLLKYKPSLTFLVGGGLHISIVPDDAWCFEQMSYEASEGFDEVQFLHTDIGGITFDEFHVTADSGGSAFVTLTGAVRLSDGPATAKEAALKIGEQVIGFIKTEGKTT